jgi:bla regulator protein blaR1
MNTLTQLFDWLLAASLRASLLTLATLLIQAALHRHLDARMRYALWLPVLIVLLMPVLPQSRWSIEHVFQTPHPQAQIIPAPIAPVEEQTPVVFEAPTPMPAPINWKGLLLLTWAGVSAGILIFGCVSFVLTLRGFKKARRPASEELLDTLAQIAREMHLRHVPQVLIASSVSSPAVTGLLRPTLLLPAEFDREFTPAESRLVLKHELMHLKRGDLPLNALMCVLMALHWFNPLLWLAFFKIRTDREAACDAQVLHDAPNDRRIEYGHALLKVETAFCPRGFSLGFVGIFQRGSALRYRIQAIAAKRAPHPAMQALVTMTIVLMTFFGITRAQQPTSETKPTTEAIQTKLETKLEKIIIPHMQFQSATVAECIEYLRAQSSKLDTTTADPAACGVNILYRPGNPPSDAAITLDLKEIPLGEALRYVVELASLKMSTQPNAVVIAPSLPATAADSPTPKPAPESLASKIIFPSIEFRDATLTECIDFLRINSRELDPNKKGVNIILKPGGEASARITLSLKNVPLSEALRYCAELTNHKFTSDAQSYFLTPVSAEASANKDQASSPATQPSPSAADAKAAELRKARPEQYDFQKARLGDVLRFFAADAGINFFALPDDNPINQKLVTFSIRASPFAVLESLCRANGAVLVFDQDRWFIRATDNPKQVGKALILPQTEVALDQANSRIRAADDPEQIGKGYVLRKTQASVETIIKDIGLILQEDKNKPSANKPQPSVVFKDNDHSFYVKATRLQHTWVSAYFQGLYSSAQTGNTK